ncbi:hypothetical protein [Streptomyces niveus]
MPDHPVGVDCTGQAPRPAPRLLNDDLFGSEHGDQAVGVINEINS